MGAHRRRHRRREEVEVPAVQRDARRRLRLRPRHGRRQGQPHRRADDDAAAEAATTCRSIATSSSSPRPARKATRTSASSSWSNEHFDEIDAEYCLAEGGGVTRIGGAAKYATVADDREDPARHRADRARHLRPRLDPAEDQRDRRISRARSPRSASWRPPSPLQRDDRRLLPRPRRRSRRRTTRSTTATC